ncbi:MAG: hypothetical protein AUH11_15315 [Acidobacteria bacterium 13_2_20CM_57_17]|nr:MAG: hypothetical protein AUH11_15315 [Acidobacteria bacterium 13_2_20CM_57_17]
MALLREHRLRRIEKSAGPAYSSLMPTRTQRSTKAVQRPPHVNEVESASGQDQTRHRLRQIAGTEQDCAETQGPAQAYTLEEYAPQSGQCRKNS